MWFLKVLKILIIKNKMEMIMVDKKKLVLLQLDDVIYKNLKKSAVQSCRAIGNEVALRIEHALSQFHDIPKGFVQMEKISVSGRTDRIVQAVPVAGAR